MDNKKTDSKEIRKKNVFLDSPLETKVPFSYTAPSIICICIFPFESAIP